MRQATALADHERSVNDSSPVGNRFIVINGNETRSDLDLKCVDATLRARRAVFAPLRFKYHLAEVAVSRPNVFDR